MGERANRTGEKGTIVMKDKAVLSEGRCGLEKRGKGRRAKAALEEKMACLVELGGGGE